MGHNAATALYDEYFCDLTTYPNVLFIDYISAFTVHFCQFQRDRAAKLNSVSTAQAVSLEQPARPKTTFFFSVILFFWTLEAGH